MSIKKEMLNKLTEQQLKQLAESKGIDCSLNQVQKKYYEDWTEKDKLIDIMTDNQTLTIAEIEKFITIGKI